jgi:catechol 2,3-dioxygenase-like lactoylglutathione lyase family enzyme
MAIATDMVTAEYHVADMALAREFYGKLLGRGPDFEASPGFVEWEVLPGYWLQLRETDKVESAGPVRFRVDDIEAERRRLADELGVEIDAVKRIDGVVAYCTFHDPFGNPLGILQDLAR